jgi:hypothetical protein
MMAIVSGQIARGLCKRDASAVGMSIAPATTRLKFPLGGFESYGAFEKILA